MAVEVSKKDGNNLAVGHDQVHLWFAELDRALPDPERLKILLDAQERARSLQFHFEGDRRRFIARRAALRILLGRYSGIAPESIRFEADPAGKPRLAVCTQAHPITFSVSHSQGSALFGFARGRRIGVDLEFMRDMTDMDRLVAQFFAPGEKQLYFSLPAIQRRTTFFRLWTAKEAFLKATGEGLSGGLDQFEIVPCPDSALLHLRSTGRDACEATGWLLENLTSFPGFAAAVAAQKNHLRKIQAERPPLTLQNFSFDTQSPAWLN